MKTLYYGDAELIQFVIGEDWFVFTTHFTIHAPIDRLLTVVDDLLDNQQDVQLLENLDLCNAIEVYREDYYPEQCLNFDQP